VSVALSMASRFAVDGVLTADVLRSQFGGSAKAAVVVYGNSGCSNGLKIQGCKLTAGAKSAVEAAGGSVSE